MDESILIFIAEMCKNIAERQLVKYSSGNFSIRNYEEFYITSSGACFERIYLDPKKYICCCNMQFGSCNNITSVPSSEVSIHHETFLVRSDFEFILHFQSEHATTISCFETIPNLNVIPEIPYYLGNEKISVVPYFLPGSRQFTEAIVKEFSEGYNLIIAKNHGIFVGAKTFDLLLQRAIFFELACNIVRNGPEKSIISYEECEILSKMRKD